MTISFSFDNFRMIGVSGNLVYLEGQSYEEDFEDAIICMTPALLKRALALWIKDKKQICTAYNHFCGAMGSIVSDDYKELETMHWTWYDRDTPDGRVKKTSVYQMLSFDDITDMEHG